MSNLVRCIRKGKAYSVPQPQFMDWFTDNFSAELITKEQWQFLKADEINRLKVIGKHITFDQWLNVTQLKQAI